MPKDEKDYNDAFERLVSGETDIVGHVAYALYKIDKQEWIKQKKERNEEIVLSVFVEQLTDRRLDYYRMKAESIITRFAEETASNALAEAHAKLEEAYRTKYEELAQQCAPKSWFYGFWQGIASSLAMTFLLGFVILIIVLNNGGIAAIGEALINFAK